jgi:hypothetical protein
MATKKETKEVELHPDAWERFERAAGVVAKSPPQHRIAKKKTATKKRRAKKGLGKRAKASRRQSYSNLTMKL